MSISEGDDVDQLAIWIGGVNGRYQLTANTLLGLLVVAHSFQMMGMKFLSYPVDHWYV